jgi:hypothetical protein
MNANVTYWRGAAWNLLVLAVASVGTMLAGVDPMLLMLVG